MSRAIDKKRALSFRENALLYDKARPSYPPAWISDLQASVNLEGQSRILEVGAGTGKATADLVKISKHITCLDPGQEMLEVAKRKFPGLAFVNSTFENFDSNALYDLIVSAMAWHWVDPETGYKKAHKLLSKKGFIVIIRYYHIDDDPESFHNRAQRIYERYNGTASSKRHSKQLNQIKKDADALNNRYFHLIKKIEYKWQKNYSIDDYLALRNTYSDHITMDPGQREKMEYELRDFAEREFDGKLTKKYTTVLFIAQKAN